VSSSPRSAITGKKVRYHSLLQKATSSVKLLAINEASI
jgi:hypothetical protein